MRSSTRFVDDKDGKAVRKDLRTVYTASTQEAARTAMDAFTRNLGRQIRPNWWKAGSETGTGVGLHGFIPKSYAG
ncbi:MAG: hypothetical protein IPH04_15855 [Saprospirales bacterium]|nr:hypothetical protein [Saprospirales bacterium]